MPEKCLVSENNTWTLNENIFQLAVLLFHKTNNSPTKPLSLLLIHIFWNEILMLHHKMFKNLFNSRTQNRFGSFYWKLSAFYSVQKTGPVLRNQTISVELLKYLSDNFACLIFSYLWRRWRTRVDIHFEKWNAHFSLRRDHKLNANSPTVVGTQTI